MIHNNSNSGLAFSVTTMWFLFIGVCMVNMSDLTLLKQLTKIVLRGTGARGTPESLQQVDNSITLRLQDRLVFTTTCSVKVKVVRFNSSKDVFSLARQPPNRSALFKKLLACSGKIHLNSKSFLNSRARICAAQLLHGRN